jgi:hypothetical protein
MSRTGPRPAAASADPATIAAHNTIMAPLQCILLSFAGRGPVGQAYLSAPWLIESKQNVAWSAMAEMATWQKAIVALHP